MLLGVIQGLFKIMGRLDQGNAAVMRVRAEPWFAIVCKQAGTVQIKAYPVDDSVMPRSPLSDYAVLSLIYFGAQKMMRVGQNCTDA